MDEPGVPPPLPDVPVTELDPAPTGRAAGTRSLLGSADGTRRRLLLAISAAAVAVLMVAGVAIAVAGNGSDDRPVAVGTNGQPATTTDVAGSSADEATTTSVADTTTSTPPDTATTTSPATATATAPGQAASTSTTARRPSGTATTAKPTTAPTGSANPTTSTTASASPPTTTASTNTPSNTTTPRRYRVARSGTSGGYWTFNPGTSAVTARGGAAHYGDASKMNLIRPIIAFTATPAGAGYWMMADDGGIFTFGDAQYYGSTGDTVMNGPAVDLVQVGAGYFIVDLLGTVYPFGEAKAYPLSRPTPSGVRISAAATRPDGGGYWLLSLRDGVFPAGSAAALGGGSRANVDAVDIEATPTGNGYWVLYADGTVENWLY